MECMIDDITKFIECNSSIVGDSVIIGGSASLVLSYPHICSTCHDLDIVVDDSSVKYNRRCGTILPVDILGPWNFQLFAPSWKNRCHYVTTINGVDVLANEIYDLFTVRVGHYGCGKHKQSVTNMLPFLEPSQCRERLRQAGEAVGGRNKDRAVENIQKMLRDNINYFYPLEE